MALILFWKSMVSPAKISAELALWFSAKVPMLKFADRLGKSWAQKKEGVNRLPPFLTQHCHGLKQEQAPLPGRRAVRD
jgi:hypothetical protein